MTSYPFSHEFFERGRGGTLLGRKFFVGEETFLKEGFPPPHPFFPRASKKIKMNRFAGRENS
jgi:hypothetical protein